MEALLLARAKHLLDRVSNNVKYPTLDGAPALPAEAAALIECLGKLGLIEDADAMRKDFIVYFAHEVRLPNTGLDSRLVEFRSKANELFGPFLKYSRPEGDSSVVRLRLIDQFDGLRITFKKLSMLSSLLTPPTPGAGADEPKAGTTTQDKQGDETADGPLPVAQANGADVDQESAGTRGGGVENAVDDQRCGREDANDQRDESPPHETASTDTKKYSEKKIPSHTWDGTALDASRTFIRQREDGAKVTLKNFCVEYCEKTEVTIRPTTLEKKLSGNRDKWDPDRKYK